MTTATLTRLVEFAGLEAGETKPVPKVTPALLVTFTQYSETDRCGRNITAPTHHTVGFLRAADVDRYTMYHKPSNGGEFFISKHVNVKMRPCHIQATSSRGGWKDYTASYGYMGDVLFVVADADAGLAIRNRPLSRLSFASSAVHVLEENGMSTFAAGNCKYKITATD